MKMSQAKRGRDGLDGFFQSEDLPERDSTLI